jgi:DNA ligase-1
MFKETLYGLDKKDGVKVWCISVEPDTPGMPNFGAKLTISHGKIDGKQTSKSESFTEGKQGRNALEQAISEAEARTKKQLDKNYRRTVEELTQLPLLPMLASDSLKVGHRLKFEDGVDVSNKLDGLRLLAKCVSEGVVELLSRTGQPYDIPHIAAELAVFMRPGEVLDGEIYLHGEALQDITSAAKRTDTQAAIDKALRKKAKADQMETDPKVADHVWHQAELEADAELREAELIHRLRPQLRYVIFDVPSSKPWHERYNELVMEWMGWRIPVSRQFIDVIRYTRVFALSEVMVLHKEAVSQGYEGVMLRNRYGMYESGKRSGDLQKYKEFLDGEFEVTNYDLDKDGSIIFTCKNDLNDLSFCVVFGSREENAAMLSVIHELLRKYLKVKFQTRYKKTLLPQFPTGVMFREGKFIDGEFVPSE